MSRTRRREGKCKEEKRTADIRDKGRREIYRKEEKERTEGLRKEGTPEKKTGWWKSQEDLENREQSKREGKEGQNNEMV